MADLKARAMGLVDRMYAYPKMVTTLSLGISLLLLFVLEVVIMAGPYKCHKYDNNTNTVSDCDLTFGSEASALGKEWNISTLEQCALVGLRRDYPKGWGCNDEDWHDPSKCVCAHDKPATLESTGADGKKIPAIPAHKQPDDCDITEKGQLDEFWSKKNLSHFNFYDFHSAPAFMLATNERKGQNHLGYQDHDVSGMKGVYATGAKYAMYERFPLQTFTLSVFVLVIVLSITVGIYQFATGATSFSSVNITIKGPVASFFYFVLMVLLTLCVFSSLYAYTWAEEFLSPLPTRPSQVDQDRVYGNYSLIKFTNLTFVPSDVCPISVAEAINSDPGQLMFDSTGVHGSVIKSIITVAVFLYLMPLIFYAQFDTYLRGENGERRVEMGTMRKDNVDKMEHLLAFVVLIAIGACLTQFMYNDITSDRCGEEGGFMVSGLGASPGSQNLSYSTEMAIKAFAISLTVVAGLGLVYELLLARVYSDPNTDSPVVNGIRNSYEMFKRSLHSILFIVLFVISIFLGQLIGTNASDVCEAPYTSGGSNILSGLFLGTMLLYVLNAAFDFVASYSSSQGSSKSNMMGYKAVKKPTSSTRGMQETFI